MKTSAPASPTLPSVPAEVHELHETCTPQTGGASTRRAPAGNRFEMEATALSDLKPRRSTDSAESATSTAPRARTATLPGSGERMNVERRNSTATMLSASSSSSEASAASGGDDITFVMPPPCSGALTKVDGRLRCEQDHGVQGVLDLVAELDPALVRDLQIPPGAKISIAWDERLPEKMDAFMKLADGSPILATDLLREAIDKGEGAFMPYITMPGSLQHPTAFLRDIGIRIQVTPGDAVGAQLQAALARKAPGEANAARIDKFRNDFGAMSLLSLANNKTFNRGLAYGLAASMGGTGTLGAAFDYGIWARVKAGMSPGTVKAAGPLIDAITPLLAETFDSMVVKRLAEVMKGKNFFPDDLGDTVDDLKGAAFSGTIAAIGSIANNYVRELAAAARDAGHSEAAVLLLVAKQFTNLLATWTSGAMVPLDVLNDHKALVDSKLKLMHHGVIPTPDVADVRKHIGESAMNTVRAARGPGTLVRSMATGGEIAASIGLVLSLLEHKGVISSSFEQLMTLLYSTPVEVLSMTSTMAAEKWVGNSGDKPDARRTNDAGKQSAMLASISSAGETSLADLDRIARPAGDRNAALGHLVTVGLGGVMNAVDKGADLGMVLAGKGMAPVGKMLMATADVLKTVPYVEPVLKTVARGVAGGSQFVFDHAFTPVGQGIKHVSGEAYSRVLKPTGQGIAWTAGKAAPVLAPVGRGAAAVAAATGEHVVKPLANASAAAVDNAARVPGAVIGAGANAGDWVATVGTDAVRRAAQAVRQRPATEPSGDDMV
ncbi:hypothetical protein [Pandoraea sp. NPDC087047]|uniref:hypothetical protein n=1 Tax=Pandoraea sp. NPDC087047 TaxID=3364390 RepID=UPI0037FBC0BD